MLAEPALSSSVQEVQRDVAAGEKSEEARDVGAQSVKEEGTSLHPHQRQRQHLQQQQQQQQSNQLLNGAAMHVADRTEDNCSEATLSLSDVEDGSFGSSFDGSKNSAGSGEVQYFGTRNGEFQPKEDATQPFNLGLHALARDGGVSVSNVQLRIPATTSDSNAAATSSKEEENDESQNSAAFSEGEQKILVKKDSGHSTVVGTPLEAASNEKRRKKLKQKEKKELGEPKFEPMPSPSSEPESRRLRYADDCNRNLFETTFTDKLQYPIEIIEEQCPPPPQPKSCCCVS